MLVRKMQRTIIIHCLIGLYHVYIKLCRWWITYLYVLCAIHLESHMQQPSKEDQGPFLEELLCSGKTNKNLVFEKLIWLLINKDVQIFDKFDKPFRDHLFIIFQLSVCFSFSQHGIVDQLCSGRQWGLWSPDWNRVCVTVQEQFFKLLPH